MSFCSTFRYKVDDLCKNLTLVYVSDAMVKLVSFYVVSLKVKELIEDVK